MSSPEDVLPAGDDTVLVISGLGGFLYQARGLSQSLEVIKETQQQVRTVNATLIDISNPAFRKYSSKISCTDVDAPPLDGLFPGMTVTVECAVELCYPVGNPGSPHRPEVSGSSYERPDGRFVFYRPVLTMIVRNVSHHLDEWKHENQWEIELEEI